MDIIRETLASDIAYLSLSEITLISVGIVLGVASTLVSFAALMRHRASLRDARRISVAGNEPGNQYSLAKEYIDTQEDI